MTRRNDRRARRRAATALGLGLGLAAALASPGCGGGHGARADGSANACDGVSLTAADGDGGAQACWPVAGSTPGGTIEIGAGREFEPLPESLKFTIGGQGGTFLTFNARIKGLDPGNPDCFLASGNPRTRFIVTLQDGTQVGNECPGTVGYKPSPSGAGYYERAEAQMIPFLPFELGEKAFNTEVDIKVEIIDDQGHYASDEGMVLAKAPDGYPDAGP